MNRERAGGLADKWVRAHGPEMMRAQPLYHFLEAELMSLLPDLEHATVARLEDAPVVLGLDARGLYVVRVQAPAEEHVGELAALHFRRVPLVPETALVSTDERLLTEGQALVRARCWEIKTPDLPEPIVLRTRESINAQFARGRGPDETEIFGRAVARALEWEIPDPDPGIGMY